MNNENMAMLAEQWEQICQNYSSDALLQALQFVQEHSVILVDEFYKNAARKRICTIFNR